MRAPTGGRLVSDPWPACFCCTPRLARPLI